MSLSDPWCSRQASLSDQSSTVLLKNSVDPDQLASSEAS